MTLRVDGARNTGSCRTSHFVRTVSRWWNMHRRDLPWRKTRDPYRILVAEIMLQQTQVSRVLPKYQEFLQKFPTLSSLSRAPRADVLRIWSGLGYNRRAVNLHRTAKVIDGSRTAIDLMGLDELKTLPGVGEYTARAVAAFVSHAPYAPIDTNIRRILTRHFGPRSPRDLQHFADTLLKQFPSSAVFGHMLMDFGALVCTEKNPTCGMLGLKHIAETAPRRTARPFKDSNRYWRGRIVAVLAAQRTPRSRSQLANDLRAFGELDHAKKKLPSLLQELQRDGIVTETAAGYTL